MFDRHDVKFANNNYFVKKIVDLLDSYDNHHITKQDVVDRLGSLVSVILVDYDGIGITGISAKVRFEDDFVGEYDGNDPSARWASIVHEVEKKQAEVKQVDRDALLKLALPDVDLLIGGRKS